MRITGKMDLWWGLLNMCGNIYFTQNTGKGGSEQWSAPGDCLDECAGVVVRLEGKGKEGWRKGCLGWRSSMFSFKISREQNLIDLLLVVLGECCSSVCEEVGSESKDGNVHKSWRGDLWNLDLLLSYGESLKGFQQKRTVTRFLVWRDHCGSTVNMEWEDGEVEGERLLTRVL